MRLGLFSHRRALTSAPVYRLGSISLDARERRLTRQGVPVTLTGLPLSILELLLASPGKLVTRCEIKQRLWPHAQRIDIERRLNTAMRALREALGDTAEQPRYIETVRGYGYRWIAIDETAASARHHPRAWTTIAAGLLLCVTASTSKPASQPANEAVRAVLLAVDSWRESGDARYLHQARTRIAAARERFPADATLTALAADIAVAGDWEWRRAETLYRRALIADPRNFAARSGLAWLYANEGRTAEAWPQLAALLVDRSLSPAQRSDLGWLTLRLGRPDIALTLCERQGSLQINRLACRHTALAQAGRLDDAKAEALRLLAAVGADPAIVSAVRAASAQDGYRRFLAWRTRGFVHPRAHWFQRAQVYAEGGLMPQAMASLERAVAVRDPLVVKMASTPAFAPIARTARFQALRAKVFLNS